MSCQPIRVAFAGSPEFAVPALQAISEQADMQLSLVVTQPDKPGGRGLKLQPSAVKRWCQQRGIDCFQPLRSDQALADMLQETQSTFFVVAAFGQLLREEVLAAVSGRCLNIHASLLPRWRGASPVQSAILAGDRITGISIMHMVQALDAGAVLHQESLPVGQMNTEQLMLAMSELGAKAIVQVLRDYDVYAQRAQVQDESQVTWARKLKKTQARIDWQRDKEHILRQIRAFNPNPVAFSEVEGQRVKIYAAHVAPIGLGGRSQAEPGRIVKVDPEGVCVACADGILHITCLQMAGSKVLYFPHFGSLPHKTLGLESLIFS